VVRHGRQGWYLYGASSNVKRNLMPSYALQWAAMRDLRVEGCLSYDLFGIPPYAEAGHPMFGLYQFKTGFGGRIVHTPGGLGPPPQGSSVCGLPRR
jgi:lipid II:glycine glycyltransferase (peptidoglycan interpeptide bridge formation enzyme)